MFEQIRARRSIRKFTADPIEEQTIDRILEMGTWAPSGLNNQPWKFVVVRDEALRHQLAEETRYAAIIRGAPVCIAVFLDRDQSYDRVKDIQAIGACIQNMLLCIHHMGLGAVWLGEILKNRENVERMLAVPEACELMAVIALGRPAEKKGAGSRKPVDQVLLARK
jgi:nitroreductase